IAPPAFVVFAAPTRRPHHYVAARRPIRTAPAGPASPLAELGFPFGACAGAGDAAGLCARTSGSRFDQGSASRRRSREALDRAHSQRRAGGPNRPPCCDVLSRPVLN